VSHTRDKWERKKKESERERLTEKENKERIKICWEMREIFIPTGRKETSGAEREKQKREGRIWL
jgi:hypothetical protein